MGLGTKGPSDASPQDVVGWSSDMLVAFLDKLANYRAKQPLHRKTTRKMAELYGLDDSKNAEIRGSWYKLAINAGIHPGSGQPCDRSYLHPVFSPKCWLMRNCLA